MANGNPLVDVHRFALTEEGQLITDPFVGDLRFGDEVLVVDEQGDEDGGISVIVIRRGDDAIFCGRLERRRDWED